MPPPAPFTCIWPNLTDSSKPDSRSSGSDACSMRCVPAHQEAVLWRIVLSTCWLASPAPSSAPGADLSPRDPGLSKVLSPDPIITTWALVRNANSHLGVGICIFTSPLGDAEGHSCSRITAPHSRHWLLQVWSLDR